MWLILFPIKALIKITAQDQSAVLCRPNFEDVLAEAVLMGDISIGDTVDVSLSCEGTKKKIVVKKKTFADEKK